MNPTKQPNMEEGDEEGKRSKYLLTHEPTVIGYVGRVMSWKNPFSQNAYLIQIICLTIAPAFLAAGIYLCLSRIVLTIGAENSRIKPLSYPRIFIPCDVISLLLQAAGGGLASAQSHANESPDLGDNIMVAGLAFQVLTLLIFMVLATDFAIRTAKRYKAMDEDAFDASHAALRQSFRFRGFVVALAFATLCIFTRSVYRVAELSEGWTGYLIETQRYFIGLEGAIVSAAVLALNVFHPGFCFRDGDTARKAFGFGKKRTDEQNSLGEKVTDRDGEGESGESSDAEGLRPQPVDKQVGEI